MTLALIKAEIIKATRQRALFSFAYLLVPVFTTLLTCVVNGSFVLHGHKQHAMTLVDSMARCLSVSGNPIAQLFFALGAGSVFTVDYRYSGWRQLIPRASRQSIMSAKILAFGLFSAVSLLLVLLGDASGNIIAAALHGFSPDVVNANAVSAVRLVAAFIIAFLELMSLGAIVATVSVLTRSMVAAVIFPFLLSLTVSSVEAYVNTPTAFVPLPTFAADALRVCAGLSTSLNGNSRSAAVWATSTLVGWCILGFGLAICSFHYQDLVAE